MALNIVAILNIMNRRFLFPADLRALAAAIRKRTPDRNHSRIQHESRNGSQPAHVARQVGDALEQIVRVRVVCRPGKDLLDGAALNHLTAVDNGDVLTKLRHDAEVMGEDVYKRQAYNPKDKTTYFQSTPTSKGFNQLHLNALYDLCNRVYVNAIIQPAREENENRAMCDLIDYYDGISAIFIADRGYENYNIFAHTEEKGMYYLIRVKDLNSNGILSGLTLPTACEFDIQKTICLLYTSRCV